MIWNKGLPDHDPRKHRLQLPLPKEEERRLCTQTEKQNKKKKQYKIILNIVK